MIAFVQTWALVEALFAALATAWYLAPLGQWIPALILAALAGGCAALAWVLRYVPGMALFCLVDGVVAMWLCVEVVKI